jgi:hypothetical protein
MKRTVTMIAVLAVATLSLVWSPAAAAQALTSGPQQITLNVTVGETLTLTCTPSTVNFTGSGGTLQASAPISCQTSWNLGPSRTQLTVMEYFSNPFVFGSLPLGPSTFSASVDGGPVTPFSNTSSTIAGITGYFGPNLLSTSPSSQGTRTDTTQLAVSTASLPPGSYNATLNILAIAQ